MIFTAKWGPNGFTVSQGVLVPFDGFQTGVTLKKDSENDTSGTPPTNTRGRELQVMSFSTTYLRAAGVDPRKKYADWEAELGNAYPLMIGGERFGPPRMKLTDVKLADLMLSPGGVFLGLKVSITLEEVAEGKTSKLAGTTAAGASSQKTAAMNVTASKADKAVLKPSAQVKAGRGLIK